jgi:plasmid stability protein
MDDTRPSDTEHGGELPDTRPPRRLAAVPRQDSPPAAPPAVAPLDEAERKILAITAQANTAAAAFVAQASADMLGREFFMVALPERFAVWLRRRAAAHGHTPEHHAASLLRAAWQNDEWRLTAEATLTGPQSGAGSFLKR